MHHVAEFLLSTDKAQGNTPLMSLFWLQGITTYEYVVALRAKTEQLGTSVDELDQTSQHPSPASSAVTATSARSSLGLSIQYRGVSLCTPPNIFMDQQVKTKSFMFSASFSCIIFVFWQDDVIQHLEPGPVRSTIDPDSLSQKKPPQRQQVRINPWKLAKLDSQEASKAAAKARASSSVLLPVSSRQNPYKTSSNVSGRSSPASTHHTRKGKADLESCSLSSPGLTRDHFNPMYMSSPANESPLNEEESRNAVVAARRNFPSSDESSVVWDPKAGRFVSSSRIPGTDFGGPLGNERLNTITSSGTDGSRRARGNPLTGYFQQVRSQRGDQLPVFMPTDSQLHRHLSTRFH